MAKNLNFDRIITGLGYVPADSSITSTTDETVNGLVSTVNTITAEINDGSTGLQAIANSITEIHTDLLSADSTILSNSELMSGLIFTLNDNNGKLETVSQDITELKTHVTNTDNNFTNIISDASETLMTKISITDDNIESVASNVIDLSTAIDDPTTGLSATSNAVSSLSSSVSSLDEIVSAQASQITSLNSTVGENISAISSEQITRANADEALANDISTLSSTVDNNAAAITSEASTRASMDSSLASSINTLSSTVGTNTSAISNEQITRTNADNALASSINSLSSTLGSHTTSISQNTSTINGISAKYSVLINSDGTVSGYELIGGGGSTSTFTFKNVTLRCGPGNSPSGNAFEVEAEGVVHVDNLFGGILIGNNSGHLFASAITGYSFGGIQDAVRGTAVSGCTGHGVRGESMSGSSTSGLLGTSVGFDVYADGNGTNYGPFTGAHDAVFLKSTNLVEGDIVVDINCIGRKGWSNTLFLVEPSSIIMQKNVIGVVSVIQGEFTNDMYPPAAFNEYTTITNEENKEEIIRTDSSDYNDNFKATYNRVAINALGEGQMNVIGENGNISAGDYIVTSSTIGKGMRQTDDVLHNYTVAKARESVTFSSTSEVKQIACIYVCG